MTARMDSFYQHFPYLPKKLYRLGDLAFNLWFSWHSEAIKLFRALDEKLWEDVNHNPVRMLHQLDPKRLDESADDDSYIAKYNQVIASLDNYINLKDTWFAQSYPEHLNKIFAYFSMEFGVHECLPIYSGGLGVLAGDHLKSASDLGLPLVAMGLLYREAYFTQFISLHGHQQTVYLHNDFSNLAVSPVLDSSSKQMTISIKLDHKSIAVRIWKAQIGRIPLYLLDTDFPDNPPKDRKIMERLYVTDRDKRLMQEIILGIGGVIALKKMGIIPTVYHMNEGHNAFLGLQLIRQHLSDGKSMEEAIDLVKSASVFTTHTPIPAGNEVFNAHRIDAYFKTYWESMGMSRDRFYQLAQSTANPDYNAYNMTILALRLSSFANGVSQMHGDVSRRMWQNVWPDRSIEDVPIRHITNGIHSRTWITSEMKTLLDQHLTSEWRYKLTDPEFWKKINDIPDSELWKTHTELRTKLIEEVRKRLVTQRERNGEDAAAIHEAETILDPNILTIGFARRFAPYKRATLIFRNRQWLKKIITNSKTPVQIIFAGKAHPADQQGKALINEIYDESRNPEFQERIVYVEDYNMALARRLVSGVDVWMNTPQRPHEASGTSGMKAAANGGLNFSVLDGWWCEGYNGENGWAIGEEKTYYSETEEYEADSHSIYRLLEEQIVPLFYKLDSDGLPKEWVRKMKNSMVSLIPVYNTCRMVHEYVNKMYVPVLSKNSV